jgi:hypothetical protein
MRDLVEGAAGPGDPSFQEEIVELKRADGTGRR